MSAENEAISSLREALKVSPNNVPLREHQAQTLLGFGRAFGLAPIHGSVSNYPSIKYLWLRATKVQLGWP